jgi:Spy/CpxP family protein refolding chaperone
MNQKHWKASWMTVLMVAGLSAMSLAQDGSSAARGGRSGRGAFGFIATLEQKVGLTPEQRDAVRGLLAEQRQKSQAMREETDGKIRALLNPEQQKKFDTVLADQKARFARNRPSAS